MLVHTEILKELDFDLNHNNTKMKEITLRNNNKLSNVSMGLLKKMDDLQGQNDSDTILEFDERRNVLFNTSQTNIRGALLKANQINVTNHFYDKCNNDHTVETTDGEFQELNIVVSTMQRKTSIKRALTSFYKTICFLLKNWFAIAIALLVFYAVDQFARKNQTASAIWYERYENKIQLHCSLKQYKDSELCSTFKQCVPSW